MGRGEFREIDHTADLGLDLRGEDPAAVLEAASRGLVQLLFGETPRLEAAREQRVELRAEGYPELLKAWCERLYRLLEEEAFVPLAVAVEDDSPDGFRARVRGGDAPRETLAAASELKGVTWHQLAFEPDEERGGWKARVIFDV